MSLFSNICGKYLHNCSSFITVLFMGIFAVFISHIDLFAQNKDTSVVKKFPEVRVEEDRILSGSSFKYSSNEKIDIKKIKEISPTGLSDILNKYPGIFIKDYGGLGGIKSISVRGTSSDHTLIMLNGIKLNSSQNSTLDLSKIPVSMIENIEIMRGGNSAAYGGNAIGGIINLNTGSTSEFLRSKIEAGSYGFINASIGYSPRSIPISVLFDYTKSEGNYKFQNKEEGIEKTLKRKNSDLENFSSALFFNQNNLKVSGIGIISKRGIPGAVLKGNIQSENARFDEYEGILNCNYSLLFDSTKIIFAGNHRSSYSEYYGNENSFVINDKHNFTLNESQLLIKYDQYFSEAELNLSSEIGYSTLAGNMLQPESNELISRTSIALTSIYDYSFGVINEKFNSQAGLRFDHIENAGNAISPVIGILYDKKQYKINFQYSYNFRAPSFNEMYYINYGNDDLLPEYSHSFNLGTEINIINNLKLKTSLFLINTENKIVSVPKSPVSWTAENIGNVENKGVELSVEYEYKIFEINFAYTLQDAIDRTENSLSKNKLVPYIPQEIISSYIAFKYHGYRLNIMMNYNSFTYSLPGNEIESVIPSHLTFDINLNKSFKIGRNKLGINLKSTNLINEKFEIIKNYPMPMRQFYLGVNYELL